MRQFFELTDELQTDKEILAAIYQLAKGNDKKARQIWESPTSDQLCEIIELVTESGGCTTDFCWGAAGSDWANN
jgi:hypothetical protein